MRQGYEPRRALYLDIGLYLLFSVFAFATALWSEFFGYRLWGTVALFAYLFGLGQAVAVLIYRHYRPGDHPKLSPRTPIALVVVLGMAVPLVALLVERLKNITWSEQPEVWVVERSAVLLLRNGTPYTNIAALHRAPVVDDYTPYGPAMTIFGLPRALLGHSAFLDAVTDARVCFAVASVAIVACALRLVGSPRVPIVALILLALALFYRRRPALCGAVISVAVSMKLTASPALIVLAVAVLAGMGRRALLRFLVTAVGLGALITVPVLLVDPASFVEHVLRFPVGLGRAHSPADSPLPGNLIARLGPTGHAVSLGLLAASGLAMAVWLVWRPPRSAADAAIRIAAGLGGAIMLAPATRYGYLVYPVVLLAAAITLRQVDAPPEPEFVPARRTALPEPAN
jgi:hypothetical protein